MLIQTGLAHHLRQLRHLESRRRQREFWRRAVLVEYCPADGSDDWRRGRLLLLDGLTEELFNHGRQTAVLPAQRERQLG